MSEVARYILAVTAAAMAVAILESLAGRGTMGAVVKLIGGVFMALTILSPVLKLELPDPQAWFSQFSQDGTAAAAAGKEMADDASRDIITRQVEAYILDKAALWDASLDVEVTLDEDGRPACVTLTGDVSPYAKARLRETLESDLGLGEEAQQWIG